MFQTSLWRTNPEHVLLNCSEVREMPGGDEFVVQFTTKNGHYTSFVPKQHVDAINRRLHACIVADVDDGVLILIPAETLTSGPRLLVEESERKELLTVGDWVTSNGIK
ncbi:MAG: hypothetical protein OXE87_03280 [Chloroflexi bacterium]|nr:hypothetical protein [Chloroflexota bacterium]